MTLSSRDMIVWLHSLDMSPNVREFIGAHLTVIRTVFRALVAGKSTHKEFRTVGVYASCSLFKVAVDHATLELLRELLIMFLRGVIQGTSLHGGPLSSDHAAGSSAGIQALVHAGVFTNDGQRRDAGAEQRGYVCGSCLVPRDTGVPYILEMLKASSSCFAAHIQGAFHVHTRGSDGDTDVMYASQHDVPGYIWVTLSDGVGCTNMHVDDDCDVYNLARHGRGQVVCFMVWDPTWPEPGETRLPAIEARLLRAVVDSGLVTAV